MLVLACVLLASAFQQNNTLVLLDLTNNAIGNKGTISLSDALCSNDSLKEICLLENQIGDDGAASFVHMLTVNYSVETIQIGGFEKCGLDALLTCILYTMHHAET